jgi:hypothetical protein
VLVANLVYALAGLASSGQVLSPDYSHAGGPGYVSFSAAAGALPASRSKFHFLIAVTNSGDSVVRLATKEPFWRNRVISYWQHSKDEEVPLPMGTSILKTDNLAIPVSTIHLPDEGDSVCLDPKDIISISPKSTMLRDSSFDLGGLKNGRFEITIIFETIPLTERGLCVKVHLIRGSVTMDVTIDRGQVTSLVPIHRLRSPLKFAPRTKSQH